MLEKINQLTKFKYSFIAVFAMSLAIIVNLLFVFNLATLFLLSIICMVFMLIYGYFKQNYNFSIVLSLFFVVGLVNSSIYNNYFRVFDLPEIINDENAWVKGQINEIKVNGKYAQVIVKSPQIYTDLVDGYYIPKIIVSTYYSRLKNAKVGDEITAKTLLKLPSGEFFDDDFDYGNYLLQNRINLTAQVRGALYITTPEHGYSFLQKIANYRLNVAKKINDSTITEKSKGISIALITGFRGWLSDDVKTDFKNSGLAHLMAISGMHMGFLSLIVFVLIRYIVCLVPAIALNYDSKKVASFVTIFFALFYLLLAGCSLPTLRAFIMVFLFAITFILNRNKLALHTLCLSAIVILLFDPMAIFSASFQLSFSAVLAMLVYNELKEQQIILDYSQKAKIWRNFINILNISIIAFTATMFVVAVHFSYISIYSIIANIGASLLMAFLVMPVLFAYFIGYVVLNIQFFNTINNFCLELLIKLAHYFANFEHSSIYVSLNYSIAILFVSLIILTVLVFNISRKYLISLMILLCLFIVPIKLDLRPKVIEFNNKSVALRIDNEVLILGNIEKIDLQKALNFYKLSLNNNLQIPKVCDISGCVYEFNNKKILTLNEGFDYSIEDIYLTDYVVFNY
jgi:competence protein ComEC